MQGRKEINTSNQHFCSLPPQPLQPEAQIYVHDAAHEGRAQYIQLLLSTPSPLNAMSLYPERGSRRRESSMSPLQEACWSGSVETVQTLLQFGASVSYRDECHENAFHYACTDHAPYRARYWYDSEENDAVRCQILRMLLDAPNAHGKDVMDSKNWDGNTPLALAVLHKLLGCCEILLSYGFQAVNMKNEK